MDFDGSIEVFQDVSFEYPIEQAKNLRERLRENAISPWCLDSDWESQTKKSVNDDIEIIAFRRGTFGGTNPCYLTLWGDRDTHWRIPNVVPQNFGERLSVCKYNEIINEFVRLVLKPALNSSKTGNAHLSLSNRRLSLTGMMSTKSIEALVAFLSNGFPGTRALHTGDERRLCDFIISLADDKCRPAGSAELQFDADQFRRWLEEAKAWSHQSAENLSCRIDQGLTLLERQRFKKVPH